METNSILHYKRFLVQDYTRYYERQFRNTPNSFQGGVYNKISGFNIMNDT